MNRGAHDPRDGGCSPWWYRQARTANLAQLATIRRLLAVMAVSEFAVLHLLEPLSPDDEEALWAAAAQDCGQYELF